MSVDNVKSNTLRSNEMLESARRHALAAEALPEGDDKRQWHEEEAQRLIAEAKFLTEEAKKQATRYK